MNSTMTSTTRLARALAVGVALAGLSIGTVGVGTAGAAQVDHPSSLRGHDDPPGDDHGGHGGGSDDGAGDDNGGDRTRDDDRVIRTGSCSAGADWKLKVKTDDGRLEVEGEVDSDVAGQQWRWTLRHNGSVSDRGAATTTARSGSFEVERKVVEPRRNRRPRVPRRAGRPGVSRCGQLLTTSEVRPMRWLTNPVAQFLAAGFVTLVVVVLATSALSRSAADEEAIADARSLTWVLATSVAQPAIPRGLTEGDAAAIDRMDRTALDRLLVDDVLRIKLWDADGTVLYSDRTELIGARYPLGDDELEVLRDGGTDAELSDLGRPENRFERDLGGDLLEVYTRVRSPEGEPLLFEAYLGVDDIRASRAQILDRFLPITIGALLALVALGTPLVLPAVPAPVACRARARAAARGGRPRLRRGAAAHRARPPRRRRAGPVRLVDGPLGAGSAHRRAPTAVSSRTSDGHCG